MKLENSVTGIGQVQFSGLHIRKTKKGPKWFPGLHIHGNVTSKTPVKIQKLTLHVHYSIAFKTIHVPITGWKGTHGTFDIWQDIGPLEHFLGCHTASITHICLEEGQHQNAYILGSVKLKLAKCKDLKESGDELPKAVEVKPTKA